MTVRRRRSAWLVSNSVSFGSLLMFPFLFQPFLASIQNFYGLSGVGCHKQGMFVDGSIQLMGAITALCSTGML